MNLMPISFHVDADSNYFISRFTGEFTDADLMNAYMAFYEGNEWRAELNELVDLGEADAAAISIDCLARLADYTEKHLRLYNIETTKTAIYAPSDLSFGLGRMYASLAAASPETVRVFRNLSDAKEWLGYEY